MLFLLLFSATFASATDLSRFQSDARASHLQKFLIQKNSVIYEKRSTFFDQKKDLRVGTMKAVNSKPEASQTEVIAGKIRTTDRFLREKKLTFNQLTGDPLHRPHWLVDEFRITDNSVLDKDLQSVFKNLQKKEWKLENGIEVTDDLKKMRIYTDGKPGPYQTVPTNKCLPMDGATACIFEPYGVIYVR